MNNVLLTSKNGDFTLCSKNGVGINDTPYEQLVVKSTGNAEKHVIEIRLRSDCGVDFNGEPVHYKYYDCHVAHGMRSSMDSLEDTKEYIESLQEAVEFAYRINDFIQSNDEWNAN